MSEIATGGPAFPTDTDRASRGVVPGMSLRDYFAAKAMQAAVHVLMDKSIATEPEHANAIAKIAYRVSDAMLAVREKGNEE